MRREWTARCSVRAIPRDHESKTHNEDCSNSHRTKVTNKQCLAPRFDVGDPPLEGEDSGQSTENQNANRKEHESPDCKSGDIVLPRAEGHRSAEVDENGAIGEQINRRGEVGLLDRLGEPEKERSQRAVHPTIMSKFSHQSSHAKAVPQAKAASRSSDPANVVSPVTRSANATYMATYSTTQFSSADYLIGERRTMDSLSINSRRFENLSSLRAMMPTRAPMIHPRTIWYSRQSRNQYPMA